MHSHFRGKGWEVETGRSGNTHTHYLYISISPMRSSLCPCVSTHNAIPMFQFERAACCARATCVVVFVAVANIVPLMIVHTAKRNTSGHLPPHHLLFQPIPMAIATRDDEDELCAHYHGTTVIRTQLDNFAIYNYYWAYAVDFFACRSHSLARMLY